MRINFNYNFNNYQSQRQTPAFSAKSPKVGKEKLESLIQQGMSVSKICNALEITKNSYYHLVKLYDIQTPYRKAVKQNLSITKEQFTELINSGIKHDDILKKLNITDSTYEKLITKFGIITDFQASKNNISNITKEKLQEFVDSGKKVKVICEELNIPERTYSRLLDKFGILTERKLSKARIAGITREQFLELMQKGLSKIEICKHFKITESMFYKLLKRLEIPYDYLHHAKEINIPTQKLKELLSSGKTTSEIAKELGVAVTTFHDKAKIQKVKTEFRDSIDKILSIPLDEFQACLDSRMLVNDICKKFNISHSTYSAIIRKYNLSTQHRQFRNTISNIKREQILELKNNGKSNKEIYTELGISSSSYNRLINKIIKNKADT